MTEWFLRCRCLPRLLLVVTLLAGLSLTLAPPPAARAAGEFTDIGAGLPGVFHSSMAWGDYDNDGDLDILLAGDSNSGRITQIYRNDSGSFTDIAAGLPGTSYSAAAWGDYDNDGDLDILLSGGTGSGYIAQVYRNNEGVFTDIAAGLPGIAMGAVAWGDYDNDGDLDILLAGDTGSGGITRVYRNNGGSFTDIAAGLPGVVNGGSAAWGDYDNDGDLDILLAGEPIGGGVGHFTRIYRNDGGSFTDIAAGLPGVYLSSVAWGDYDNDGDLDILLSGYTGSDRIARVYRNGEGSFTAVADLPGVLMGSAVWGDYDNDGDLDILLAGWSASGIFARVYRNDSGSFSDINAGLPPVHVSQVAWGDYDNDGDLDILLAGYTGSWGIAQVYCNNGTTANTPPSAPSGLTATVAADGSTVSLSWQAATDDHTPAAALSYNLRLGTTPGGSDILSPMAAGTGFRRLPALGNAQERLTATLDVSQLALGSTVYWSVQAVDSAWAGGPFADEDALSPASRASRLWLPAILR